MTSSVSPSLASLWLEGARPRTLPAAAAPVVVGTAAAVHMGSPSAVRALLALFVALALQVGVNYSNDYSDGIRGTDDARVGPPRLTASGRVRPRVVLAAALACFSLAGVAGLALLALSGQWWLALAGVAAVAAAWFYTGGRAPYGYMGIGLSELMVFVFFGLMACVGTTWVMVPRAPWWLWVLASALGLLSVAMLMVNNIRDIATDRVSGKMTLAVRLGRPRSVGVFLACLVLPVIALVAVAMFLGTGWLLVSGIALVSTVLLVRPATLALRGETPGELIGALKGTGLLMVVWALLASAMLVTAPGA